MGMSASILVVDDEPTIRDMVRWCLEQDDHRVVVVGTGEEAVSLLQHESFDVVISDIIMPGIDGIEVLRRARVLAPRAAVILITAYATVETAVEALRRGAADYLLKPFRLEDLRVRVARLVASGAQAPGRRARSGWPERAGESSLVGRSAAIQAVRQRIERVGPTGSDILITGETGTGKELVARAVHAVSRRSEHPFIAVNCAAIPEALFESTLFGHARGAFTSAVRAHPGLIPLANHGTLFLDEIGELPFHLQAKLLRVIEDKEVWPVGRTVPLLVDCRVIASTNRDLRREMEAGRFREDLFYRLNVVHLGLPPLRARREDIPLLVEHLIRQRSADLGTSVREVEPAALEALMNHEWPGNVRELLHVIESALITSEGDSIRLADLPEELTATPPPATLKEMTRRVQQQHVRDVLAWAGFDKREAARRLGVSQASLYRKLRGSADDR